jgi:hypothetical protein
MSQEVKPPVTAEIQWIVVIRGDDGVPYKWTMRMKTKGKVCEVPLLEYQADWFRDQGVMVIPG